MKHPQKVVEKKDPVILFMCIVEIHVYHAVTVVKTGDQRIIVEDLVFLEENVVQEIDTI